MTKVLLTGAAGGVGTRLRQLLPPIYPDLVLSDIKKPHDLSPRETFIAADLANPAEVRKAVSGVDAIIHFGGYSVEGPWETILGANIVGTYNLFEAARLEGVKRVVFASSNHVSGFYPRSQTIGIEAIHRPDTRYGVSKAFGEALAALYAFKYGIGTLCIRIGNIDDAPIDVRRLSIWLKPEHLIELIRIGLERPNLVYEVVYGMSNNRRAWWDNAAAGKLGYKPAGGSEEFADDLLARASATSPDPVGDFFQGGPFCSAEFTGDLDRIRKR